jgi:SAM-dependent methyltransferase
MASDHFSTQSSQYALFRPTYPAALFDFLATQVPSKEAAWDCACGSGQATVELASRFRQVIGTDLSEAQLSHATDLPNVRWSMVHAEESGLESASMDLITVAQAVHWFDLPRFWEEARRVLKPGGLLALWCYEVFTVPDPRIQSACDFFYNEVLGEFWPPERRIVEAGYSSFDFPFEELQTPQFEMSVEWTLEQLLGYLSSWSATSRYLKANGRSPIPELEEILRPLWLEGRLKVSWPLSLRVGRS